jgi:hypothetical protein
MEIVFSKNKECFGDIYFGSIATVSNPPFAEGEAYRLHVDLKIKRHYWMLYSHPNCLQITFYDERSDEALGEIFLHPENEAEKRALDSERLICDETRYQFEVTFMPPIVKTHLPKIHCSPM